MPPKTPLKTPWLALRAANKKAAHAGDNLEFFSEMAGAEGFEPPNAWTKTMCLTAWPRPNTIVCASG